MPSPLSVKTRLHLKDIVGLSKLDNVRAVYLLAGSAGSKIVIKRDKASSIGRSNFGNSENDPRSMRHTFRTMKAVDAKTASKQLSKREMENIKHFAREIKVGSKNLNPYAYHDSETTKIADKLLMDLKAPGVVWMKTDFFQGLVDLEAAAGKARSQSRDKAGVRAFAAALSAKGGLEKLGQIIAADAFNGNTDRFELKKYSADEYKNAVKENTLPQLTKLYDVDKKRFCDCETWRLVNAGNVAICLQDNIVKPVGIDPWSGSSALRNLESGNDPDTFDDIVKWSGVMLKDDQQQYRSDLGIDIADDLERLLGPRNRKLGFLSTNRLPRDAAARIALGIEQGAKILKSTLVPKVRRDSKGMPKGILKRMELLGWIRKKPRGG